jgi:hypothetical protein
MGSINPLSSIGSTIIPGSTGHPLTLSLQVATSDQVDVSQVPQLSQTYGDLHTSSPAQVQDVLLDAATKLRSEARSTADPLQAIFLSTLADRFQTAAETADQGSSSSSSSPATTSV